MMMQQQYSMSSLCFVTLCHCLVVFCRTAISENTGTQFIRIETPSRIKEGNNFLTVTFCYMIFNNILNEKCLCERNVLGCLMPWTICSQS